MQNRIGLLPVAVPRWSQLVAREPCASWVKIVGGAESCKFPTDSCKRPTEDIMGARNFNFVHDFNQNAASWANILHFLDDNFPTRRKFSHRLKFGGVAAPAPPATTPLEGGGQGAVVPPPKF